MAAPLVHSHSKKRKNPPAKIDSDEAFGLDEPQTKVLVADTPAAPVGIATDRGGKSNQEDAYFVGGKILKRLTLNGYSSMIGGCFGVFDGHGGDRASRYCAENLFPKIEEELSTAKAIPDAITNAVRAVDADFCTIARRSSRPEFALAAASRLPGRTFRSFGIEDGSTCLIGMIRDGLLYVGNVGDSRAIMATKSGKAISLSQDQKPNRKDERARLESKGATVTGSPDFLYRVWPLNKMIDVPRVNGALAMSRSIGDLSLKPFITCDPEITTHTITDDDHFLILASDGLWDVVSSKTAARIAASHQDPQQAADALVQLALQKHTYDNVTVVVVNVEHFSGMRSGMP